jgi:hypothetical protein
MRPLCYICNITPVAVNYHREDKIYYRKLCDKCGRKKKKVSLHKSSRWELAGYKKKKTCEHCDIKPPMLEQLVVFYIDSNRQNISVSNLKTVCLNCNFELSKTGWVQGDLLEDH